MFARGGRKEVHQDQTLATGPVGQFTYFLFSRGGKMSKEKLSRRQFLQAAAMTAAGAAVVACQPQTVIVKETVEVEKEVEKVVKET
ncbi:MAG: twin-arginine translocation signal domain-containing protein, partial [Anaerolineae bacterium]|nr:twin-arginine translocation signal domain-containing protein [Anaerolineae bacterium]